MSTASNHRQGLYLYVNYHGQKVYRHFTKFTDDSAQVFRDDLLEMKFALPKTINIWLMARGCVVGFWPDVSADRQSILYNNLQRKIEAAADDRSELVDLCIHSITLKELACDGWRTLAATISRDDSPRPAKRRRYAERTPSPTPSERSSRYEPRSSPETSPSRKRTWNDDTFTAPHRHLPPPVPLPPDLLFRPSASQQADPTPAQKIQRLRYTQSRVRDQVPTLLREDKACSDELKKLRATDIPPPMKLVDEASDAAKDTELELLRQRIKSMEAVARLQLSLKVRLDEAANKLEAEQQLRQNAEETAAHARQSEADAKRRLEEVQVALEREGRRRSEADDLTASTRRSAASLQDAYDAARQETDDIARRYERAQEKISLLHRDADSLQRSVDRTARELERVQQELREEKDRRKGFYDRLAIAERSEIVLRQRCDDASQQLAAITRGRTMDAQNARMVKQRDDEALRASAEKARTQQLVIRQAETAMRTAQSGEQAVKRRLEEVERSLEVEKRLRREAEDAIEDIRRECREPFVVPSLLDAFVELAKLTTVATALHRPEVGKNNTTETETVGGSGIPTGLVNRAMKDEHEIYVQGYTPTYTPPVSHPPDPRTESTRTESTRQQVKLERLSPI